MKKRLLILILLVLGFLPIKVFAAGFSLSATNITIYPGDSKTITINTSGAVGRLNISSSGGAISASPGSVFIQNPGNSASLTIKANSVGTGNVTVSSSGSFANFDTEEIISQSITVYVNVVEKPAPTPTPTPTPTPSNNNNNNSNNKQEEKKSSDKTLKSLNVEGYNLIRVDDNNYTLSVRNDITSININAAANNIKAKVEGTGLYELVVGDNPITITVTAEDGSKNVINIIITREEEEKKEVKPVTPDKKETPKKETKKKINITLKDYLLFGSLLLNVLLIIAVILINVKYRALKEASKNMVVDSRDLPFGYLNENGK